MNIKRLSISVVLAFIFSMTILWVNLETISAQDCRIVRVHGMVVHRSIRIEPETLWISKGTCVIWFNRANAEEIKVIFEDGKKCSSVSESPVGFSLDHNECYVTSWIPFGGTSSLRFVEEGTYKYVMETKGMKGIKVKGEIIVE